MAFQPVPNVALCRVEGVVDSQLTINTLHFEISGGGINAVNLGDLATAVDTWASGQLAPLLSDDWTYNATQAFDLTTFDGVVSGSSTVTIGGTSGEANPNNVAACVSLRTAQRGRSFRGRNFVPAIPGSVVTLNTLDAGWVSNLLTAYNALVGAGTFIAGWQFGIVSRKTGGVLRTNGLFIPVTYATMVNNKVRSMRSREIGHGA